MRFLLGIGLGLGAGFVGAMLFAPEKKKQSEWPPRAPESAAAVGGNHNSHGGFQGFMDAVRQRLDEAMDEARQAKQEAERQATDRYEKAVGRKK